MMKGTAYRKLISERSLVLELTSFAAAAVICCLLVFLTSCGGGTRGTGSSLLEVKVQSESDTPFMDLPVQITALSEDGSVFDQASSVTDGDGVVLVELSLPPSPGQILVEFPSLSESDALFVMIEGGDLERIELDLHRKPAGGFNVSRFDEVKRRRRNEAEAIDQLGLETRTKFPEGDPVQTIDGIVHDGLTGDLIDTDVAYPEGE